MKLRNILFSLMVVGVASAQPDWKSLNVPPLIDDNYSYSDPTAENANKRATKMEHKLNLGYDVSADAIGESLKWQNGGSPRPVLKADGVVKFPFGQYQPTVTCKPLNLCDIELQKGEQIQGILIGDSVRWNDGDQGVPVVYSGEANNLVPHLVLKPSQSGLETTLMITTSKRTYMIKLRSASVGYIVRAGFYYPSEEIVSYGLTKSQITGNNSYQNNASSSNSVIPATPTNPDVEKPLLNVSKLNYKYTLSGGSYDWKPTQVFDDGVSVYIQMPDGISSRSLPGLCVVVDTDDSKCELVNFRFNDHFYIVDKLFDKAKLVNGFDSSKEEITISRDKKGFWSRLFGG